LPYARTTFSRLRPSVGQLDGQALGSLLPGDRPRCPPGRNRSFEPTEPGCCRHSQSLCCDNAVEASVTPLQDKSPMHTSQSRPGAPPPRLLAEAKTVHHVFRCEVGEPAVRHARKRLVRRVRERPALRTPAVPEISSPVPTTCEEAYTTRMLPASSRDPRQGTTNRGCPAR